MGAGAINSAVGQAADSARPSAPLPLPRAPDQGYREPELGPPQDMPYQVQPQPQQQQYQPQYQTMDMPAQRETAWQQAPEWQGYQTQMADLQRQLDQSPLMQQMHALQSKMQGYQQQHAAPPPQYGGQRYGGYGRGGYGGYGGGIASLLGGMFKEGGKV